MTGLHGTPLIVLIRPENRPKVKGNLVSDNLYAWLIRTICCTFAMRINRALLYGGVFTLPMVELCGVDCTKPVREYSVYLLQFKKDLLILVYGMLCNVAF